MMGPVQYFVTHLFTPGSSINLLPAVNVCLVCLLGLLIYLAAGVLPKMHVYSMGGLSTFLLFAINWFIVEYKKEMQKQEADRGRVGKVEGPLDGKSKKSD